MKTKFKVINSSPIGDGRFALAGIIDGEVPDVGSVGNLTSPDVCVSVEVLGIGLMDPNLVAPDMQALLVKIISGSEKDLDGSTFEFEFNSMEDAE